MRNNSNLDSKVCNLEIFSLYGHYHAHIIKIKHHEYEEIPDI